MNERDKAINEWFEKADHDLGTAILISTHIPQFQDILAFHCQQATEKYLKAMMIFLDLEVKRTHILVSLLELIDEKETIPDILYDKVERLTGYEVKIRYPNNIKKLTEEDIKDAIEISQFFREFVIKRMNITINYHGYPLE